MTSRFVLAPALVLSALLLGCGGGRTDASRPASSAPAVDAQPRAAFSQFNWLWPQEAAMQDMPPEALADAAALKAWRKDFAAFLRARVDAVGIGAPSPAVIGTPQARAGYSLQRIDLPFPGGPTIETLLAVPQTVDPRKPVIVAIHGHEISPWETAPYALFDGDWAEKWVRAGYVVWAPSHLWYKTLASYYPAHDYHVVWARMLERLFDASRPHFPAHRGAIATGHSAGGTSATLLMALRPEFAAGVFSGSFIPLDYLRENYRLSNHPNNWDIRGVRSYVPIYALAAPRPVQWQLGKQDPFYPRATPDRAAGCCYPGTPRGVDVTETFGELFVAQRVWALLGGKPPVLDVHEGGHVYDFPAALRFVQGLPGSRGRPTP